MMETALRRMRARDPSGRLWLLYPCNLMRVFLHGRQGIEMTTTVNLDQSGGEPTRGEIQ